MRKMAPGWEVSELLGAAMRRRPLESMVMPSGLVQVGGIWMVAAEGAEGAAPQPASARAEAARAAAMGKLFM